MASPDEIVRVALAVLEDDIIHHRQPDPKKMALRKNSVGTAFYAAFLKTTNSVFVAAIR